MGRILAYLSNFFSAAPGSLKGVINQAELQRSVVSALGLGSASGALVAVLQSLLANAPSIFSTPLSATLGTALLTVLVDLARRLGHDAPAGPKP